MNESEALLFPQAWDKGDRIHLEDNITQQLAQVCSPTSLHETMHMNEKPHLTVDMCGLHVFVCNTKGGLYITELTAVGHDR